MNEISESVRFTGQLSRTQAQTTLSKRGRREELEDRIEQGRSDVVVQSAIGHRNSPHRCWSSFDGLFQIVPRHPACKLARLARYFAPRCRVCPTDRSATACRKSSLPNASWPEKTVDTQGMATSVSREFYSIAHSRMEERFSIQVSDTGVSRWCHNKYWPISVSAKHDKTGFGTVAQSVRAEDS